jgi:hypothetical protein
MRPANCSCCSGTAMGGTMTPLMSWGLILGAVAGLWWMTR